MLKCELLVQVSLSLPSSQLSAHGTQLSSWAFEYSGIHSVLKRMGFPERHNLDFHLAVNVY